MSPADWQAIILTLKLASMSTFLLMFIGPVIAWWLAVKPSALKAIIEAAVALPLVLPPTVLALKIPFVEFCLRFHMLPITAMVLIWLK